jgi:hypothetical protein
MNLKKLLQYIGAALRLILLAGWLGVLVIGSFMMAPQAPILGVYILAHLFWGFVLVLISRIRGEKEYKRGYIHEDVIILAGITTVVIGVIIDVFFR